MEKIFNPVLQARTREYMEATGTSQAELARRLGMTNSSTLSRWLNSSYSGDVEKVERSIEEYFRVQSEADKAAEKAAPYRPAGDYVPTSISEDVCQSIKYCQLHRCVTVLHGDAGVGKTIPPICPPSRPCPPMNGSTSSSSSTATMWRSR